MYTFIPTIRLWVGIAIFPGSSENTKDARMASAEPQDNSQKEENEPLADVATVTQM